MGILVAAVSFTLLTAAVDTGRLQIRGTIERNFRPAYDLLVRPPGSFGALERDRGLVAANFSSGIFGGITRSQWLEVLRVPGVEVAAPIANVGYVAPFTSVKFDINRFLNKDPTQLYRMRATWSADRGLSRYPGQDSFVYVTRTNPISVPEYGLQLERLPNGERLEVCRGFNRSKPTFSNSPVIYSTPASWFIQCFSTVSPRSSRGNAYPFAPGVVGSGTDVLLPLLVAAIDPVQEQRLLGLRRSMVDGRFLRSTDTVGGTPGHRIVPVLVSSRNYVDQKLNIEVERLEIPAGVDLPHTLASLRAFRFATNLQGRVLGDFQVPAGSLFRRELEKLSQDAGGLQNYWAIGGVNYDALGSNALRPRLVHNQDDAYALPCCGPYAGPGNQDVQFRKLLNHKRVYQSGEARTQFRLRIVGRYDPERISDFRSLSRVPLGAYSPPILEPADSASRRALANRTLLPSMNLGGYIQQPPFLLTTLDGLRFFTNPENFDGANRRAPISVIRVRVAGVTGPDELSLTRIKNAAQLIRQRTRLAVDIVAGSSPSSIQVRLPAGEFGRPELSLKELWAKKGVAITIIQSLDRKSLLLFLLILLVAGFFLANGALAAVRSRRTEIGTLAALGWSRAKIFRAILWELALIGLGAGLLGAALAMALTSWLTLELQPRRALLVAPIAVLLASIAGLVPAWRAARTTPMAAIHPLVSERSSPRSVKGMSGLARVNLARLPWRTAVGAGGLLIGVAGLTVLLAVNLAFRGSLVGSLLGTVVTVQVRGVDVLSIVLALLLSSLSVADVLALSIQERIPEFVTLRASGWDALRLGQVVALEGMGIGLIGSIPGAIIGVAVAWILGGPQPQVLAAGIIATVAAVTLATVASLVPAFVVSQMAVPRALAEE